MKITDEMAAACRTQNPTLKLKLFRTSMGDAIFKVPSQDVWETYWDMTVGPAGGRGPAAKHLVLGSIVMPTPDQFVAELNERPGLVQAFYNELPEWAGQVKVTESKEL